MGHPPSQTSKGRVEYGTATLHVIGQVAELAGSMAVPKKSHVTHIALVSYISIVSKG